MVTVDTEAVVYAHHKQQSFKQRPRFHLPLSRVRTATIL